MVYGPKLIRVVSKVGEMVAIWTTIYPLAATFWSVEMAGCDICASAQVHWNWEKCTVCAAVPSLAKPQRFRCSSLLYY